jgi:hypothetical protein
VHYVIEKRRRKVKLDKNQEVGGGGHIMDSYRPLMQSCVMGKAIKPHITNDLKLVTLIPKSLSWLMTAEN